MQRRSGGLPGAGGAPCCSWRRRRSSCCRCGLAARRHRSRHRRRHRRRQSPTCPTTAYMHAASGARSSRLLLEQGAVSANLYSKCMCTQCTCGMSLARRMEGHGDGVRMATRPAGAESGRQGAQSASFGSHSTTVCRLFSCHVTVLCSLARGPHQPTHNRGSQPTPGPTCSCSFGAAPAAVTPTAGR